MNKKILSTGIAAAFLLTACNSEPEPENVDTQSENTEEVAPPGHQKMTQASRDTYVAPLKTANFDITAQSYGERMNELLVGSEFEAKTITDVSDGDRDKVFITDYTHKISVAGNVNDNNMLQDLTYTMPVNESIKVESAALIQLVSASMQTLNDDIDTSQASDNTANLINKIVDDYEQTGEQQQVVEVMGDIVYAAQISDHGLRVVIQPKEDSRYVN